MNPVCILLLLLVASSAFAAPQSTNSTNPSQGSASIPNVISGVVGDLTRFPSTLMGDAVEMGSELAKPVMDVAKPIINLAKPIVGMAEQPLKLLGGIKKRDERPPGGAGNPVKHILNRGTRQDDPLDELLDPIMGILGDLKKRYSKQ